MTHVVVMRGVREPDRRLGRRSARSAPASPSPKGRIWHPVEHYLLFSDMPADVRRRWDQRGGVREVMRRPSNKCNGMTYDADLNLIVCEHATSSLVRERRRAARGAGLAFRGLELNSPNDVCVQIRRLDLFLRSLVRPHAGLRRRAAAPARLPGRLPRAAGRRAAAAPGRPLPVRPAERALLLARREPALRQRHRAGADPGVRREPRRLARRPAASSRAASARAGAGRAGRHEMRRAAATSGSRRRAASGSIRRAAACSARCACRSWSPTSPGAATDFHTLFMCATHSVYAVKTKVGPRHRALHAQRGRPASSSARRARGRHRRRRGRAPSAAARSEAAAPDHPGHAERRGHGGRRVRGLGLAGACQAAERGRERAPPRGCGARGRDRDPRLVHRRAGRARRDAERAAVRGRGRHQGDGARHMGRGAGRRASSRSRAISWSRRCA